MNTSTPPPDAQRDSQIWTYADLQHTGLTRHDIRRCLADGSLVRIRRDRYARATLEPSLREAVRERGRLTCCSLLKMLGIFVHALTGLHVQLDPATSHLKRRSPYVVRHWSPLTRPDQATISTVSVIDALIQAAQCLPARDVVATLDSAVRQKYISLRRLRSLADLLPARRQMLLKLVNGKADSGAETYVRLILQSLGLQFEQQVKIPGVGRVDILIEGWLILEVDSEEFHADWEQRCEDLRRDVEAAKRGYGSLRVLAADALRRDGQLGADLADALAGLRPLRFSGKLASKRA